MFTQENLSNKKAELKLFPVLLALVSILFLFLSRWLWASLYYQTHSLIGIGITIGLLIIVVIGVFAFLRHAAGYFKTLKAINFCIALLLTYFVFKFIELLGLIPTIIVDFLEPLAITVALLAGYLSFKINLDIWKRLHLAILVGGMIFIFFPVLLANTQAPTIYWPSPSNQSPTTKAPKLPTQNTIVLLLDELSASAAGPVVEQLKEVGLLVSSTSVDPAGQNTVNVIPAIWSRSNFDQSSPCGPTQLCSANHVLDFAQVHASSDNIDIVGFFHRYCSIQGLRSCFFAPMPSSTAISNIACTLPWFDMLGFYDCNSVHSGRKSWIALRDSLQKNLLEAPFWQKGGLLFAHLLAPHPLMGIPLKPLQDEYTDNVANGAEFVKQVAIKAKLVFGNDFKIIVFSDHPLRSEFWCSDKHYDSFGCKPMTPQVSKKVPLIVATPTENLHPLHKIHSNIYTFDLLY